MIPVNDCLEPEHLLSAASLVIGVTCSRETHRGGVCDITSASVYIAERSKEFCHYAVSAPPGVSCHEVVCNVSEAMFGICACRGNSTYVSYVSGSESVLAPGMIRHGFGNSAVPTRARPCRFYTAMIAVACNESILV